MNSERKLGLGSRSSLRFKVYIVLVLLSTIYVTETLADCRIDRPCSPCTAQELIENRACDETGYYQTLACHGLVNVPNDHQSDDRSRLRGSVQTNMNANQNQTSTTRKSSSHSQISEFNLVTSREIRSESCIPDKSGVNSVLRFELCMAFAALYSLNFVRKRKRAAYQRLTNIVNS